MARRWKKRFECGHRGFGRACQRCAQAEQMETKAKRLRKVSAQRQSLEREAARLRTLDGVLPDELLADAPE